MSISGEGAVEQCAEADEARYLVGGRAARAIFIKVALRSLAQCSADPIEALEVPDNQPASMEFLKRLFGRKQEQAVLVHLDGATLPDEVYETYDLATLEDQVEKVLAETGVGQYDGNEFGPGETTLFMYGPDSELLWSTVESLFRAYPLCRGARVVLRQGGPEAPIRELRL